MMSKYNSSVSLFPVRKDSACEGLKSVIFPWGGKVETDRASLELARCEKAK